MHTTRLLEEEIRSIDKQVKRLLERKSIFERLLNNERRNDRQREERIY